jgi:hypothetical protein
MDVLLQATVACCASDSEDYQYEASSDNEVLTGQQAICSWHSLLANELVVSCVPDGELHVRGVTDSKAFFVRAFSIALMHPITRQSECNVADQLNLVTGDTI